MVKRTNLACAQAGLALTYIFARCLALSQSAFHGICGLAKSSCYLCRSGFAAGISAIGVAVTSTSAQAGLPSTS
eukprot:8435192-Pyramimonas_sp.AAC.1